MSSARMWAGQPDCRNRCLLLTNPFNVGQKGETYRTICHRRAALSLAHNVEFDTSTAFFFLFSVRDLIQICGVLQVHHDLLLNVLSCLPKLQDLLNPAEAGPAGVGVIGRVDHHRW